MDSQIDEAMIRALVHGFYGRVRQDDMLGPVFERAIGDKWDSHLATMCDFWSSVMLTSGRYHGRPMAAHLKHKEIQPEHFLRWLALFGQTAGDLCPPDIAARFVDKAQHIARSLQLGLFFRPDAPSASGAPSAA